MNASTLPKQTKGTTDFRPFQAWRYNPEKINFSEVIAPPYDVIYPPEQEQLYQRSPFNSVRLVLNKIEPADTDQNNRYTRAKGFFEAWKKSEHVIRENAPAFYVYRQTYTNPVSGEKLERTAVLGTLHLEPFEKGIVVPHEKTLSQARADQRRLLETAEVSFSPVFGLYDDPKKEMAAAFKKVTDVKPLFEAADEKVIHTIWPVTDAGIIKTIQTIMADKPVYIADGHHRYRTALEYSQDIREKKKVPAGQELASDFALIALVEFHDPGLILMPTHRLLLPYAGFDEKNGLEKLKNYFKLEQIAKEELQKRIAIPNNGKDLQIGLAIGKDKFYFLTLTEFEKAKTAIGFDKSDVWYKLDVNIVAHLIFAKLWNLPESEWEKTLKFTRVESEAFDYTASGKAVAAFMLKPPRVESLREMGEIRELMPQKSTYFYPKLASGLVFYSHQ